MNLSHQQDELLWHVDEHDRPLAACRRGDAHRLGLRHRSVHILVYDGAGRVFLQKRAMSKDIHPGLWDSSAAGHVDYGETYEACAKRELCEELGIVADVPLEFLIKLDASVHTGWEFVQVYRYVHEGPLTLNADEIETGRWFLTDELEQWMTLEAAAVTNALRSIWDAVRAL